MLWLLIRIASIYPATCDLRSVIIASNIGCFLHIPSFEESLTRASIYRFSSPYCRRLENMLSSVARFFWFGLDGFAENTFLHKYLCTQPFEAIVKSTKSRFQTTKTMFESWNSPAVWTGFLLENPQEGTQTVYVMSNSNASLPRNKHFGANVITFLVEWHQKERKTKWHLRICTVLLKAIFSWLFRRLCSKC